MIKYWSCTYADNDEGSGAVEHAQCSNVEHHSVEEICQRKTEHDADEPPECEPDGQGSKKKHQHDDYNDGD